MIKFPGNYPKYFVNALKRGDVLLDLSSGGNYPTTKAIFFAADLRGFTLACERAQNPRVVNLFLGSVLQMATIEIVSNGAEIAKLLGDGYLGYDLTNNNLTKKIETAITIIQRFESAKRSFIESQEGEEGGEGDIIRNLFLSSFLYSGDCFVGYQGAETCYRDYTIQGPEVNRLFRCLKKLPSTMSSVGIREEMIDAVPEKWREKFILHPIKEMQGIDGEIPCRLLSWDDECELIFTRQ